MFPIPTARLGIALAAAGVLTMFLPFAQPLTTIVLAGVILLAALADFFLAVDPNHVEVEREMSPSLPLGATIPIKWRIRNPTTRPMDVALADEFAPSLGASSRRAQVEVPPKSEVTVTNTLTPTRRGRFRISQIAVRMRGPLGLVDRQRNREVPRLLRVLPEFKSKKEAEIRVAKAKQLEIGLRSARGKGGGTEFDQLREYTPDDEFRRIDWAATARTGTAIARTYRAELNQTVINLLDNGRVMAGKVSDVPRVEHAMDAVMALTTVATGLGDKCGLMVFDREVRAVVQPSRGKAQVGRVTEAMYNLDPALVESDYRGAFGAALGQFRRRTMIVVHTELVEAAAADFLLPALPLISRNHLVIIATVRDPEVEYWAHAEVVETHEVYRQVAAVKAIEQRDRTIAQLRGVGATVVDAPPGDLAAKLADTYLQVKASGRL